MSISRICAVVNRRSPVPRLSSSNVPRRRKKTPRPPTAPLSCKPNNISHIVSIIRVYISRLKISYNNNNQQQQVVSTSGNEKKIYQKNQKASQEKKNTKSTKLTPTERRKEEASESNEENSPLTVPCLSSVSVSVWRPSLDRSIKRFTEHPSMRRRTFLFSVSGINHQNPSPLRHTDFRLLCSLSWRVPCTLSYFPARLQGVF